ncbi:hypothetical protein S40288_00395 [Stachybotrys chartarum IBT 40288]|nr:hypothetical protein S40288_00395 [Stachybotrys chartarum IBT 40288]
MSRLDATAVIQGMADALPTHQKGDDGSDLASSYEAIALLIHSYLTALGFKLCGFDEEKNLAECESLAPRLPSQWNSGFGSLAFVYKHKQSSMRFVFRIDRMGAKVEVRGLAVGDDNIYRFERSVRDVVKASALPVRISLTDAGEEDRGDLLDKLRGVFVSEEAIAAILHDLKVNIVQKLIPKLQSEGYVETEEAEANARDERRRQEAANPHRPFQGDPRPNQPYPQPEPLPEIARRQPPPVGDFPPPGFDDELDINRPHRGIGLPGRSPFNIGHDDLHPPGLGPHDPLRGSFIGGGLPRPGGSSGMHPTFDDPLFGGRGGFGEGAGSGDGFDPQHPPGARWDPFGPGGNPRFPGPGNGQGGNPFGGGGFI